MCACHSETTDFDEAYGKQLGRVEQALFSIDVVEAGKTTLLKEGLSGGSLGMALRRVLEEKKGAWRKSKRVSYAPRLLFTTVGMSLNIREDQMVLNIEISHGKWRQYVSQSDAEQLNGIKNIVERLK